MKTVSPETSVEGAYDLAIEAAARRIQMVSRHGASVGSSGGYSSDGELSEASSSMVDITAIEENVVDTENSSLTDNSSSSGNSDSSVDTDDIDSEISYLKQKQKILEKATYALKKEEAFIALNAHNILRGAHNTSSKLWDDAKYFLDALQKDTFFEDEEGEKRKELPSNEFPDAAKSCAPPRKRPKIDTTMVQHIRARSFPGIGAPPRPSVARVNLEGTTLETALQFTAKAQIIAMPSPPFLVVFVNKAFCELSRLDQVGVIGKPVEQILRVDQDFPQLMGGAVTPSRFLVSHDASLASREKCQLQVVPITSCSQDVQAVSHLLIKIEPLISDASTSSDASTQVYSNTSTLEDPMKGSDDAKHISHQVTIG